MCVVGKRRRFSRHEGVYSSDVTCELSARAAHIGSNEPHQVIPRQGCITAEPASVSPGLVVLPERIVLDCKKVYKGKRY